jgi:hypothetical protein
VSYLGEHRRPARWVRAERPPLPVRAAARWRELADWAGVAWANLTAGPARPATVATSDARGVGGYPVCLTCRHGQHKACGAIGDDPPCGCHCQAAAMGRRAAEDRQVRAL